MNIRFATAGDWPRLIEIYNQAVDTGYATADTEPVTVESRRSWLREHHPDSYPIYACGQNEDVTGWLSLSTYRAGRPALRRTAEVSYYVAREHQNQGVGTLLMKHALTDCQRLGLRTLVAILLEPNHASIRLLQRFDFEEWGRLPNIAELGEKEWDHVYMGRRLASS
tara:strand:+ start:1227 stop:1727 length:501 start_codon:yes stop_codon:yes gene_type:complete